MLVANKVLVETEVLRISEIQEDKILRFENRYEISTDSIKPSSKSCTLDHKLEVTNYCWGSNSEVEVLETSSS